MSKIKAFFNGIGNSSATYSSPNRAVSGGRYQQFGYTSMPSFLFNSVWAHFFDKEVRL